MDQELCKPTFEEHICIKPPFLVVIANISVIQCFIIDFIMPLGMFLGAILVVLILIFVFSCLNKL